MSVSIIDNTDLWDRFVDESPHGTLFHKWKFLKILEKHSGFRLHPYGVYKGNELICIAPVFFKTYGPGLRMAFSPPPRAAVPNLGPVMSSTYSGLRQSKKENYLNAAIDDLAAELGKQAPDYTFISTPVGLDDARPFQWAGYDIAVHYTYVLDLGKPLDELWSGFSPDCKKNVKRCEKYDLSIRQTTDAETFFKIQNDRLGSKGLNAPISGAGYLKDVLEAFPDNVKMFFVYAGNEIASVALHCEHNGSMMFWMGDINVRRDIPCNEHMMWEFIKDAKARGFREIEFEGASLRQLCQYKSKFNPVLKQHYYVMKKDLRGRAAEWAFKNLVAKKIFSRPIRAD